MIKDQSRDERGFTLLLTVLTLLLVTSLGFAALNVVQTDQQVAGYLNRKRMALNAADAGVSRALETLQSNGTPTVPTTALGDGGAFPHGQPTYGVDTTAADPVESLGIGGLVDQLVNRTTKRLGGTASFLIGTMKALARYRNAHVTLRVDGEVVHDAPLVLAAAANGRYFGGGMHIAPEARLDDGLLDIVLVPDVPKRTLLAKLPLLYAGKHLHDPVGRFLRGRVIVAEAAPGSVLLDIDGEALGSLPARIEVMPGALGVIGAGV